MKIYISLSLVSTVNRDMVAHRFTQQTYSNDAKLQRLDYTHSSIKNTHTYSVALCLVV